MLQTAELLKKVRKLDIVTRRKVDNAIGGAYHSVFKGRGIEFDEVREYTYEDDVRDIDWNVSARLNAPYVKKYVEERELSVLLMVDISNSMNFGSPGSSIIERAIEAAALLGLSAIGNNDRVGLSLFSDHVEELFAPRSGRHNNLRLIRELVATAESERNGKTDLALALRNACKIMKKRGVIFIISDLADNSPEVEKALKIAGARHDVIVLHLYDPAAWQLPNGFCNIYDSESNRFIRLSGKRARLDFQRRCEARNLARQEMCRRSGVELVPMPCSEDMFSLLMKFFQHRRRRRSC